LAQAIDTNSNNMTKIIGVRSFILILVSLSRTIEITYSSLLY